jgi:hypothetical protein
VVMVGTLGAVMVGTLGAVMVGAPIDGEGILLNR